jgi:hypothetical protein
MSLLFRQLRDTLLHVVLAEPANLLIHPPHRSLPTSSISYTSFTSFTSTASFTSFTSRFRFTQTLPTFSTPSKHRAHSNARKSIPFMRLLHDSLDTRGPGCQLHATRFFRSTFLPRLNLPHSVPLTPFPATLTSRINPNSFACHSCKKTPGLGPLSFSRYLSASLLRFFQFPRHLPNYSLHSVLQLSSRSLFASALLSFPSLWCRLPGAQKRLSQRFS